MNSNVWWMSFPRKIGYPNKFVIYNKKELISNFNNMNGKVNKLYIGVYSSTDDTFTKTKINVVPFDIDWDDKYNSMRELHNRLLSLGWAHQVLFSTNGFWIYVLTKERIYKKNIAKNKLAAMQLKIIEGTTLKFGNAKDCALDYSIFGDVERLTRFPGSYDKTRKRHVIFLTQEDIDKGYDHIVKLSETAQKRRIFSVYTFGNNIGIDPDDYEYNGNISKDRFVEFKDFEYDFNIPENISKIHKKILDMMPDPVKAWVCDKERATWKARAYATLWMREMGFSKKQTENFLRPFYEAMPRTDKYKNNWEHYKYGAQVSDQIYKRMDLRFPNIDKLKEEGLVPMSYKSYKRSFIYR